MSAPTPPPPDDKDWTWTITDPCPDCGFDPHAVARSDVPDLIRTYAALVLTALEAPEATRRPQPDVWSPTEYGCHVRDVCVLFAQRLQLMRDHDDPQFDNWDQDTTARQQRYWEQSPAAVSRDLTTAADSLAQAFATVAENEWPRPGRRSNGTKFTIDTFARYLLHDIAHHAWDVRCEVDPPTSSKPPSGW